MKINNPNTKFSLDLGRKFPAGFFVHLLTGDRALRHHTPIFLHADFPRTPLFILLKRWCADPKFSSLGGISRLFGVGTLELRTGAGTGDLWGLGKVFSNIKGLRPLGSGGTGDCRIIL